MKESKLYQNMIVDAYQRLMNSQADLNHAYDKLLNLKINYIINHTVDNVYKIGDYSYRILCANGNILGINGYVNITMCIVPEITNDSLTGKEKKLLEKYRTEIYEKRNNIRRRYHHKINIELKDKASELNYKMERLKHKIPLLIYADYKYEFDEITSDNFVEEGLRYGPTPFFI